MSESRIKPHWSFWVIGIVALIWNVMGCINFVMQMNPEMVADFPKQAQALITSRPLWATVAFAVAVLGGVLAEILLLLRKAVAYYLFIASFLGVIITNIHTFQVSVAIDIWIGSLLSLVMALFLIGYSKLVKTKGWIN